MRGGNQTASPEAVQASMSAYFAELGRCGGARMARTTQAHSAFLGRGASARLDKTDVVLNLTKSSDTERRLIVAKSRQSNLGDELRFGFADELGYELVPLWTR